MILGQDDWTHNVVPVGVHDALDDGNEVKGFDRARRSKIRVTVTTSATSPGRGLSEASEARASRPARPWPFRDISYCTITPLGLELAELGGKGLADGADAGVSVVHGLKMRVIFGGIFHKP